MPSGFRVGARVYGLEEFRGRDSFCVGILKPSPRQGEDFPGWAALGSARLPSITLHTCSVSKSNKLIGSPGRTSVNLYFGLLLGLLEEGVCLKTVDGGGRCSHSPLSRGGVLATIHEVNKTRQCWANWSNSQAVREDSKLTYCVMWCMSTDAIPSLWIRICVLLEIKTKGFVHARQALCHWTTSPDCCRILMQLLLIHFKWCNSYIHRGPIHARFCWHHWCLYLSRCDKNTLTKATEGRKGWLGLRVQEDSLWWLLMAGARGRWPGICSQEEDSDGCWCWAGPQPGEWCHLVRVGPPTSIH